MMNYPQFLRTSRVFSGVIAAVYSAIAMGQGDLKTEICRLQVDYCEPANCSSAERLDLSMPISEEYDGKYDRGSFSPASSRSGWTDEDGKYHKGKACKWQANEDLMATLELPVAGSLAADNKKEGGGASFIRTTLIEFFKSITQQPSDETIRPVLFDPESPLRLNPDEINHFIKPFEAFTSLAA